MSSCFAQFFYRLNSNKTVESICGYCFVASQPAHRQEELREWEKTHICQERKQSYARRKTPVPGLTPEKNPRASANSVHNSLSH